MKDYADLLLNLDALKAENYLLQDAIAKLDQVINERDKVINKRDKYISEQEEAIQALKQEIERLLEQLNLNRAKEFGSKSEKCNEVAILDEAAPPENIAAIEAADEEIHVRGHGRHKTGRKPLPKYFARQQKIYDLPESEKRCNCGCELSFIADVITEQVEIIPAKLYVIEHIRKKYACKTCEDTIKLAAGPLLPIPKSIAGPGLLAHIIVAKYEDHLPLYRQEHILQRLGIDITRATTSAWVIKCANLLKPLYDKMQTLINTYDVAYCDESTLQVLKEENKEAESKSYMWCIAGGEQHNFCYVYCYDATRSAQVIAKLLPDFSGYLHCDGYTGYDSFASTHNRNITQVGCWYHARRKFVDAAKVNNRVGVAKRVLNKIQKLSHIEAQAKEQNLLPTAVYQLRQEKSLPILDELQAYLETEQKQVLPKSVLGQAISYTLNQWDKLLNYTKDGRLAISNNLMERTMKPFATGRKNWLFANSIAGAEASAIHFSFIESCKYHGVDPYYWYKYVFEHLPYFATEDLHKLLPFNIDKSLIKPPD